MAQLSKDPQIEIVEEKLLDLNLSLEKTMLSFTEVGSLLKRKPSVIAQYAKAGVITPIQQGSKKVIPLKEVYLLEACIYAVEHYGANYTICKLLKSLLKNTVEANYKDYILGLEEKSNITKDEVAKYVNSYKSRGIYQKQKNQKSEKSI